MLSSESLGGERVGGVGADTDDAVNPSLMGGGELLLGLLRGEPLLVVEMAMGIN